MHRFKTNSQVSYRKKRHRSHGAETSFKSSSTVALQTLRGLGSLDVYPIFACLDLYTPPIETICHPHWTYAPPLIGTIYATLIRRIRHLHWKRTPLNTIYDYSNEMF